MKLDEKTHSHGLELKAFFNKLSLSMLNTMREYITDRIVTLLKSNSAEWTEQDNKTYFYLIMNLKIANVIDDIELARIKYKLEKDDKENFEGKINLFIKFDKK